MGERVKSGRVRERGKREGGRERRRERVKRGRSKKES